MNSKLILAMLGASVQAMKLQHPTDNCDCIDMTPNLRCDEDGENCTFNYCDDEGMIFEHAGDYGAVCKAHDSGLAPFCDGEDQGEYCDLMWCYVSAECTALDSTLSTFPNLAAAGIHFSY